MCNRVDRRRERGVFAFCDAFVGKEFRENEPDNANIRGAGYRASVSALETGLERCGGKNAPSDEIGHADATNERIGGFGVGFLYWPPQEEKRKRIVSAEGDTGDEESQNAHHLTTKSLIVIAKHYIKTISRTEGSMVGRN
jgi:hypothetical protein